MISFSDIYFSYSTTKVLKGVSASLCHGEFVILLGRNGSGKTTFMHILSGLLLPSKGKIKRGRENAVNLFTEKTFLYNHLTVRENIHFFSKLVSRNNVEELLQQWDLLSVAHKKVNELSKGYKVRVSLCRTFLNTPDIILLDEPTSFLDGISTELLIANILSYRAAYPEALFIICTHDIESFRSLSTRVLYLSGGKLVADSMEADCIDTIIDKYKGNLL